MSTLERARAFAKRSTLSAAMSILPFALAAVNADAAAVTLTPDQYTPVSVALTGFSDQGNEFYLLPTTVGDVDGQKLAGGGFFVIPNFSQTNSLTTQDSGNVTITAQGLGAGTFTADTVGVTWDFTLSEFFIVDCRELCEASNHLNWMITYSIDHEGGTNSTQVSGGGDGNFMGSSAISGLAGISPLTWSIVLSVNYDGLGGISIDIPENSVAIPGATQAIPEPGTVALMGAGFAVLALRRFRRA